MHIHTPVRTHIVKHTGTYFHIYTGICTSCSLTLSVTVFWLLYRHANTLTCHCDAYYGCLWWWKLTFSMVLGDDGDYKSTWSAYSVMAYYTPFYWGFILAVDSVSHHTHTRTQLAYKSQPHSSLCCLSLAHAEYVMRVAWVRLRQILNGVGGSVSLPASVLWWRALKCFCWPVEWPAGSTVLVSCHLS